MTAIAIIPARSGSQRIRHKNVKMFHGKPIMAYSIEVAKRSGLFEDVIVSTDEPDYGLLAKKYGAKVHLRSKQMARDEIGTQEVTRTVLLWYAKQHKPPEYACCIYATAPLLSLDTLALGRASLGNQGNLKKFAFIQGIFYWGKTEAFIEEKPLAEFGLRIPSPYWAVDINTQEDWTRAEALYAENLQEEKEAQA